MSRDNDYTTENVFDFLYHQNYYKRIGIDLSRQTNIIIEYYWVFLNKLILKKIRRRWWCNIEK